MTQPLVLLSGLLCDEIIWADVADRLADIADIRIIAFAGFTSIGAMAEHVLALAPAEFALAGHSMGGRVALEVVRRVPQRVTRLALLNTGAHPLRSDEREGRNRLVRLARERGMSAVAAEWLPPMMGSSQTRSAGLMRRLTAMVERATPESFAAQINALLERPDAEAVLPTISVRTLLLSGTADTWSPLSQHRDMLRSVPHARLVGIEGAGHMAPIEQPDAVARELREWLAAILSVA